MSGAGSGFAGTVDGSFFRAPRWVDKAKPAGSTVQVLASWDTVLKNWISLKHLYKSPNFVWLSISAATYLLCPYDLDAARRPGPPTWIFKRFLANLAVTLTYFGFWEITLYHLALAERKFSPNRWPSALRLAHNVLHTCSGVVVYTIMEAGFVLLWARGRLQFIEDRDLFTSPADMCRFVVWTALVPIWRSFHFYFSHRFLHLRFLYKYVHCLHHFNVDVEPFAGLCMHPVEHVHYFSCIGLSLYFRMHPFHLLWNGMHLLLSPAASHSGWEDNLQSDQFHYVHHARFECNYGSASLPLDRLFGTFRNVLSEGAESEKQRQAEKQDLGPLKYSLDMLIFLILSVTLLSAGLAAVLGAKPLGGLPLTAALAVSHGPLLVAAVMSPVQKEYRSLRWLFDKKNMVGSFGLHVLVGWLISVLPVFHLMYWLVAA